MLENISDSDRANDKIIQIPLRPQPGEIWFSINLGMIDDVPAVYELFNSLGLKPTLAYK